MDLGLVLGLALIFSLGFVLGGMVGANRAFRLVMQGRALRKAHARIARFLPDAPPTRSEADMIARVVPVRFGTSLFRIPVLPRAASREWISKLDESFAPLAAAIDGGHMGEVLALMEAQAERLLDFLIEYDRDNILPSRAGIDEIASDGDIVYAILEVWRAANPLVAGATWSVSPTNGNSAEPSSSSRTPTDGDLSTSRKSSPTSSSSSTSTPRRTASSDPHTPGSRKPSKRSASEQSSRATARHTRNGAATSRAAKVEG